MKVCHILDELVIGGLEKTVVQIASGLSGYTHEVWCLTRKGPLAGELEKKGVRVEALGFSGRIGFSGVLGLARLMRPRRFDIIHCHGHYPSVTGRAAAMIAGARVRIVHAQGLYYWLKPRDRARLFILSRFTTRIIAVSGAVKKSLSEFVGIDPAKITVVYNSSPDMASASGRSRQEIRASFGIGPDDFVIGAAGRLEERKGYNALIEAASRIGGRARFIIAGEGPERAELEAQIASKALKGAVFLAGARRNIGELLGAMDCFVQSSRYTEGMPLALAEAASASLPLIATDVGGNPEIVADGVNGFIVRPDDPAAIAEKARYLINNPVEWSRMSAASRTAWEERFSENIMLEKIKKIYDESVKGR